jgi:alpha-1,3-rhamnosyltransferase
MPSITVLVPSYNHAPFVERTLRSIFAQTLKPEKLIVIDDGSKDESARVIETMLRDHAPPFDFAFFSRENRGLCATLNEGLAKTDTEYFAYLGSDDIWLPNFLKEQCNLLESRPNAVLAFGHAYLIDEEDNIIDRTDNWTRFADGDMLPRLLRGEIFSSPTVVYRTAALKKYGWNEDARLEDYELYLKLSGAGEFARNEKILSAWRQHESNTSDNFPLMLREQLEAQDRAAGILNMTRAEMDEVQAKRKFRAIFDMIRTGYKREALALFWETRGHGPLAETLKLLPRFAVPQALFQWNRRRKRRAAMRKYGKVKTES